MTAFLVSLSLLILQLDQQHQKVLSTRPSTISRRSKSKRKSGKGSLESSCRRRRRTIEITTLQLSDSVQ
jgi:hypothetical protein